MNNLYSRKQLLAALLCLICSAIIVPSAGAMIHVEGDHVVRVSYSDLNLSNDEGIVALYQRLKQATGKVCGRNNTKGKGFGVANMQINQDYKKCKTESLNKAVINIDNDQLTALHTQ